MAFPPPNEESAPRKSAPRQEACSGSAQNSGASHLVQFYRSDSFLCESVAMYAAEGLQKGEGVLLIATDQHLQLIVSALVNNSACSSIEDAVSAGQLVLHDAESLLQRFFRQGLPQPDLFREVVGTELKNIKANYPSVRAYGEMVNLLWSGGNLRGTLQLEELWTELARQTPFSLLCGYDADRFTFEESGVALRSVCAAHGFAIPDQMQQLTEAAIVENRARGALIADLADAMHESMAELIRSAEHIAERPSSAQAEVPAMIESGRRLSAWIQELLVLSGRS